MQRQPLLAAYCSLFITATTAAFAQQPTTPLQPGQRKPPQQIKLPPPTEMVKYDHLRQPPGELPALSSVAPPDSKFRFGLKRTDHGATDVQLYWDSAAAAQSIVQSYAAQFQPPTWRVIINRGGYITAVFRGNVCSVRTQPGTGAKGSATRVLVDYQFRQDK
jgi:hypothetical protein